MQTSGKINWQSPAVRQIIKETQETLLWLGRDSRIVRVAYAYNHLKKQLFCKGVKQGFFYKQTTKTGPLKVFFFLAGGLGDAVCASRLVHAYQTLLSDASYEIYCPLPQVAQMLFGGDTSTKCVEKVPASFQGYDLVVFACLGAKFLVADEQRLRQKSPSFGPVFQQAKQAQQALGILLEDPFLTEGLLGRLVNRLGGDRFDLLQYTGGVETKAYALSFPQKKLPVLKGKKYITFHDGTSAAQPHLATPSRAWPYWQKFIRAFKQNYPDYLVVQVGGENSPAYAQADVCLVKKTSLQDLPGILKGASLHVDTESGLVHLAQLLRVPCVVLFGPSDKKMLGYENNSNLSAGDCGGCMWMTKDWMAHCPLGQDPAPCMQSISVEQVLQAVKEHLTR